MVATIGGALVTGRAAKSAALAGAARPRATALAAAAKSILIPVSPQTNEFKEQCDSFHLPVEQYLLAFELL
jgi:hypothetical protein